MQNKKKIKVALFGHPADMEHFDKCVYSINPNVKFSSDKLKRKVFEWTPSHVAKRFEHPILQDEGKCVKVFHTLITFLPEMINLSLTDVINKIFEGFEASRQEGATYVGLGAFTSIACIGREKRLEREFDLHITSGNTLTAALAMSQLEKIAHLTQTPLENSTIAIIGASGDIGSGCAVALKDRVRKLVLTARGLTKLKRISSLMIQNPRAEVELSDNIPYALKQADIVIATASATEVLIHSEHVKPGTIICDIAFPKSISEKILLRDDVIAFAGGIAKIPQEMDFGYEMALPNHNTTFGCFAEAMVLAMEGYEEPFSQGRGKITVEKMNYILNAAKKYGIVPAGFYSGKSLIGSQRIQRVAAFKKSSAQNTIAC